MSLKYTWIMLGAAGLSLGGFFLLRAPMAQSQPQEPAPACTFEPGAELGFTLKTNIETTMGGQTSTQGVEGELHLRALSQREDAQWQVAAVLTNMHGWTKDTGDILQLSDANGVPFIVTVARDCRFSDFGFSPDMAIETRAKIRDLFQTMEVLTPAKPGKAQWTRAHHDALGTYTAIYSLDKSESTKGPRFHRTRSPYSKRQQVMRGVEIQVEFVEGDAYFMFDRQGAWLSVFDGNQRSRISLGAGWLDVKVGVNLHRDDSLGPFPITPDKLDHDRFIFGDKALESDTSKKPTEREARGLAAKDIDSALDMFTARLRLGDDDAAGEAAHLLAAFLRAHPEAAKALLARLRTGALDQDLQAAVFLALEIAGTKEARAALVEALRDGKMSTINRMRAAAALPDVPSPSEDVAKALMDLGMHRPARGDSDGEHVASSALLAMGTLAKRTEESMPELSERLHEGIQQVLSSAKEAGEVTAALDAIGNSGDERFAAKLTHYERHDTPMVREHAARAYRNMDTETREPALVAWFGRETDVNVRETIAETLLVTSRTSTLGASELVEKMAINYLPTERSVRIRAVLVEILGTVAKTSLGARAALIAQFHAEQDPELLVLIGKYCSVEELR